MAMDAKDLRIETALGAQSDDGNTKYGQSGTTFHSNGNKPYHDIGSNSLAKVDVSSARPCAIIGPDRIVPPHSASDAYAKKAPAEPWPCTDNIYQHPPEYPHKPADYQLSRNISPRQTFQENMQRIMVPPSYASVKNSEDHCLKNSKLIPLESKFCDVPYTISPINNEAKIVKTSEGLVLNNNSNQPVVPHGWPSSGVNVRPLRPYGAPDLYQYSEYSNCPGPRPISMIRPHRNVHEDVPQVYQDRCHEANIRFKPYPTTKERPLQNPHLRYDYIPNYPNAFQPHASYPHHKYELQKSISTHPYSVYPPVPLKYLERRMPVHTMEKYPRSPSQQVNFNQPFSNQNIPSTYGTLPGNCLQNRAYPYAPDPSTKNIIQNRLYFDSNNARKYYTSSDNMFMNDINRTPTIKSDLMYPTYPPINIHSLPPHHMYRKENSMKGYEHAIHYRNIEYSGNLNPLGRLPLQFSPQTMSISPSDSNTSNDATQILGNIQDDCGYASQSSTASIRSIESGINRISKDINRRPDITLSHMNKFGQKLDTITSSKDKKGLDVRQFLQMWNEGDDEGNDNNKEATKQRDSNNPLGRYETGNNQEQLYVLDLVNVPKEDLGKYDHIQKISKLPENIKGYNSIELLNQYEKLVESPVLNQFSLTPLQSKHKDLHVPIRNNYTRHGMEVSNSSARPLSPLDVEAKISQSVIHKEVGCNFEIRPCSPQMMNVELATPVHNVLGERLIEKVVNPITTKSPLRHRIEETTNSTSSTSSPKIQSCKMANNQYPSPHVNDSLKPNYCLQDLESSSGVCLASLPRLDNDIELSFPEINQQFINDNKMSSIQDLPILDTVNSGNVLKSKVNNTPFITEHVPSGSDSDKDVSKLSKYRKQKRNSIPSDIDDTLNMSLHRTDSVIIKNPENLKCQEEYVNNVSLINNNTSNIENIVNHTSVARQSTPINYSDKNSCGTINENLNDYKSIDNDIAIDFSLNKCDDIQSNSVSSFSHLSDALQNNIEIEKNIYTNNEGVDSNNDKLCSKKFSKQLEDNITILHPTSPKLSKVTESNIDNNSIVLQSVDESNPLLKTHETVITHSKPKEVVSDISSLPEESISHNSLPSLTHENGNMSTNLTTSNSSTSESIPVLSNDIKNQALNYCLTEHPEDVSTPVHDLQYNLEKHQNDHDTIKHIDVENISCLQQDNTLSRENVSVCGLQTHSDPINNSFVDLGVQNPEDEKIQTILTESEENKDNKNIKVKEDETSNANGSREHDNTSIDFKSEDYGDFNNKCSDQYQDQELINVNNLDLTPFPNNNNLTSISIKDFNSTNIPCTENDFFKNDDSISKINTNICSDEKKVTAMSPPLVNENLRVHLTFQDNAELYQVKYGFSFKKELFSSRVQNLLIYCEGPSVINYACDNREGSSKYFDRDNICVQLVENNSKISVTPHVEEKIANLELENNTSSHIVAKKIEKITSEDTSVNLIEIVESGKTTADGKSCDQDINNIFTDVDKEQQNDAMTKCVKEHIHIENFIIRNNDSESLVEVVEQENNDPTPEHNIEMNNTMNNPVKEKITEHISWNQLPNRRNRTLKRSLSESAIKEYASVAVDIKGNYGNHFMDGRKRARIADSEILVDPQVLTENFTSFIQNNRRNSVSTVYNEENVSFCIFIDNDCVLTEENESSQKICYTEIPDECLTTICTEEDTLISELTADISYEGTAEICSEVEGVDCELTANIYYEDDTLIYDKDVNINSEFNSENIHYEESEQCPSDSDLILQNIEDKTAEEPWVEDVACMETVFSDDIAEDIIIDDPSSAKDSESSEEESNNTNFVYNINRNEYTNKVKRIYGNKMCDDDVELVEKLYRTPQMNVNKTLIDRESQLLHEYNRYYDNESLEKILSEPDILDAYSLVQNDSGLDKSLTLESTASTDDVHGNKENEDLFPEQENKKEIYSTVDLPDLIQTKLCDEIKERQKKDCNDSFVHSCESSCDNYVCYKKEEKLQYAISSSPEVSSTTSEEKGPAILLKIRSYKGSKISEVNEMCASFNHTRSQRPLITKAAQKYIPPLKETIHDLKVKIRLPKQSLYKLQQLKKSKEKPKIDPNCSKLYIKSLPQGNLKKTKPKPKFEDVLMSIDEIQFKKHKTKIKRNKQSVPKVIIKKNESGAHYASTQAKETFNPDLTGRKWQPWVFLEKSNFVDKMALKQKFKAVYSHRKKTYVLAENFRKYKSISNAKFIISHPKSNDNTSTGKLKYTFRLKHS